ncbi:MAG: hypothetical protein JW854_08315 [Actinobacteria bacterium]|nr:hypothetical protein [Actinomycetota bacterium]
MNVGNAGKRNIARASSPFLSILLVLLLFLPSAVAVMAGEEAESGARVSAADPLGRLPEDPQEAHQRLEESDIAWPCEGDEAGFEAAGVQPGVRVALPYDTVEGFTTHANAGVKVDLWHGGSIVHTINTTTNNNKWFYADFADAGKDIQSGDQIDVTDLADMAKANVNCNLTCGINISTDRVSGNTQSGNIVDVYIKIPNTYYGDIPPGVAHERVDASGGNYSATFSGTNIRNGDEAYVFSTDGNDNVVMNVARSGPVLVVYPQYDEVMGFYNPGVSVGVKAGSATQNVGTAGDGFFDAWFVDHDILPGEQVSCVLGTNRSIITEDISATADPFTNIVQGQLPPDRLVRITMNTYRDPVMVELQSDANGYFIYDFTGLYDISGIEVYNVAWYNDAGDCVVYEFQTYSWYMPEGYTGIGFDEWVLIMNPGDNVAYVRVVFQTLTGEVEGPLIPAQPGSRVTVHVNDWVPEMHVSTMVTSIDGTSIMAERAMYMYGTPDGKWGAHDSIGILTPSPVWYLPEGATYFGFDEWVLIQNPNGIPVQTKVQFLERGGVAEEFTVEIGATSRYTVHVNEYVPDTEISTRVESLTEVGGEILPVFAERAMYMATADGKRGAHDSIGLSTPAPEWYLPEGTTRTGFDEWVLVMNPNDAGTTVRATFLTPEGIGGTYEFFMVGNSRGTIHVNDFLPEQDVSTVVTSLEGAGILAERAMYINTADGKRGAHDSVGAYQTGTYWFLPEGTTRPGFDEWVLVLNPNSTPANVLVTLLGPDGPARQLGLTMQPNSRLSVHVNEMVDNLDVSTVVESIGASPVGILAERAMYMWTPDNKQGSHDSIGIPSF